MAIGSKVGVFNFKKSGNVVLNRRHCPDWLRACWLPWHCWAVSGFRGLGGKGIGGPSWLPWEALLFPDYL